MAKSEKILTKDQSVILGASALIAGFLLGLLSYHLIIGSTPAPVAKQQPMQQQMPTQQQMQQPAISNPGVSMQAAEEIKQLKAIVEKQPKNRDAWVKLGNNYYDSGQAAESIQAYTKALEIDSRDPNVLTDRGIMYRAIKDYQSALADFKKAADLDKSHTQSVYNMGIVYLHDLQDNANAIKAWEELVKRPIDPQTKAQIEQNLATLRNMAK